MNDWRLVLQWADLEQPGSCKRYSEIAVAEPVQIAVFADKNMTSAARSLHSALDNEIQHLGGKTCATCICCSEMLDRCEARNEPSCRSILVVFCSNQPIDENTADLIRNWESSGPSTRTVLPILPVGADPQTVLPSGLNRIIALRDTGKVRDLVASVLLSAGVGSEQSRMFISYKRSDSEALADQLSEEFSKAGFQVFLDRFRGIAGRRFPAQLAEELVDKGLVLVLESPNVLQSPWTIAEVAFANLYRLGLLSVLMPNGNTFGVIPNSNRFSPSLNEWNGVSNQATLSELAVERLIAFVRTNYARQLILRRVYLQSLLEYSLLARSANPPRLVADGTFFVSANNPNTRQYSIELATRQPFLGNVRRVQVAATSNISDPVVVGPRGYLEPTAKSNFDWLAGRTDTAVFEEVEMLKMADRIARGVPLP